MANRYRRGDRRRGWGDNRPWYQWLRRPTSPGWQLFWDTLGLVLFMGLLLLWVTLL